MDELKEQKKALRRICRERAAKLTDEYRREADRAMREALLQSELWRNAAEVFLYVSVQNEPDTRALIEDALGAGKRVYVPLCCAERVMNAVRIRSLTELRPGVLGIPEPPADNETAEMGDLDLAIVPCVTATREGQRLGHGAGYYDRFLQSSPCKTLCLCYEAMLSETVPTGALDIPMDCVLSERAFYQRPELILSPDRNPTVLPAKFAPCCVEALDHISPLCSADFALPDTNFARNSLSAFYQGIV